MESIRRLRPRSLWLSQKNKQAKICGSISPERILSNYIPPAWSLCFQVSKSQNKTPSQSRLGCVPSPSKYKEDVKPWRPICKCIHRNLLSTKDSEYRGGNSQKGAQALMELWKNSQCSVQTHSVFVELQVYCNFNPDNFRSNFLHVAFPKLRWLVPLCHPFTLLIKQETSQSFTFQNICLWKDLVFQYRSSGLVSVWDHYLKPRRF